MYIHVFSVHHEGLFKFFNGTIHVTILIKLVCADIHTDCIKRCDSVGSKKGGMIEGLLGIGQYARLFKGPKRLVGYAA